MADEASRNNYPWSEGDDRIIIENHGKTAKQLSQILHRSETAVAWRRHVLCESGKIQHKYLRFTPEEDFFILTSDKTLAEIGEHLGRGWQSIGQRRKQLGIAKKRKGKNAPRSLMEFKDFDQHVVKKEICFGGTKIGTVSLSGTPSEPKAHAVIKARSLYKGRDGYGEWLIQGFGGTPEEAVLDAIQRSRREAEDYLTAIGILEEMVDKDPD